MKLGGYSINVVPGGNLPQKVATGFTNLFDNFVGANYTPIAYLGSKVVNGINHAILAEQNLVTGNDVRSIVLLILNEKPGDVRGENFSIVEIRTLLSNGGSKLMGGINIAATCDIPKDAQEVFDKHFGGYFGAKNKAFALLATQVVNGIAYYFAVESSMVVNTGADSTEYAASDTKSVQIVKCFSSFNDIETVDVISGSGKPVLSSDDKKDGKLGYAFTWLSSSNWP